MMIQNTGTPTPTPTPTPTCSPTLTPPPPAKPTTATFAITLNQQGQPLGWHMVCGGQDYGPGNYPTLSVPKDAQGVFNFTIGQGANFAANGPGNQINAIGIVGGAAKPPQAGNGSGLITVSTPTATTLSFTDANTTKAANKLNYILYFSDGSKLDPIIDNGGCCTREFSFSGPISITGGELALYLLVAFFAGMATLMGLRAMKRGG